MLTIDTTERNGWRNFDVYELCLDAVTLAVTGLGWMADVRSWRRKELFSSQARVANFVAIGFFGTGSFIGGKAVGA